MCQLEQKYTVDCVDDGMKNDAFFYFILLLLFFFYFYFFNFNTCCFEVMKLEIN